MSEVLAQLEALRQALVELRAQGGWAARRARYRELAGQVREKLMRVKDALAA